MDDQNTSMEELKVDDEENVKEISMEEDILGAQSLLMSDSDDEDAGGGTKKASKSPLKKISPMARKQGDLGKNRSEEKKDGVLRSPANKISHKAKRILDSDSEDEPTDKNREVAQNISNVNEEEENIDGAYSTMKRISTLIDSDSDNDREDISEQIKRRNHLKLIDSDSESAQDSEVNTVIQGNSDDVQHKKKTKKSEKNRKKSKYKEDNSDDEHSDSNKKSEKIKKKVKERHGEESDEKKKSKIADLVDSDSEENSNDSEMESELDASAKAANFEANNNDGEDSNGKVKNKSKVMRASAKKALDEMQAIQSEQQRLHREASISIPYHKPKKHTLQDFLNRRTIIKPQSESNSPVVEAVRTKSLRMNQEELEEYAKLMDERAKEATEFFKSESEDELEEEFKDNPGILDKQQADEKINEEESENVANETEDQMVVGAAMTSSDNVLGDEKENLDDLQLTEEELAEILAEEGQQREEPPENPICSKVLITEVIELPKLDMNTVKISPVKKILPPTPRPSLNVKQLLAAKNLSGSPSLSGDPNKLIDLDTGDLVERKPTGVENLMQRLMSTVKARKSKTTETCNILSTENGRLEMTKVNVSLTEDKDPNKEPKPGAAYFELQRNLKEIIKKKRLKELHKKQEEEIEYNKCLNGEEDDDEEEEDDDGLDEEEYEPDSKPNKKATIEIDDEENPVIEDDEEEKQDGGDEESDVEDGSDDFLENEADDDENQPEEKENDDDDCDDDDDDDDDDIDAPIDRNKRNRIIKAFDDSDDDNDFLKTQPPTTQPPIFDTQTSLKTTEEEENELIALCSGTFDATQKRPSNSNALMSQIPLTQNQGKAADDDELMELCSGTFDEAVDTPPLATQQAKENDNIENHQPKCNKIVSSDEEESKGVNGANENRTKKLTKKLKKKTAKLNFSDDEDEDEKKYESDVLELEDDFEQPPEEEPATFIDYDSEENEIVVQMTKKDCVKQAEKFFEKEAELSESEWGSADEDEKNLDKYDIELGDEDEFDKEKIRSELEQIHARKMLDEDLREVRKIQEMLFEDEEKDGVGRQRQFKWKNAESGFSLDDGPRDENGDGNNGDSGDELNEHQWRKIRFEREQFLKEQGLKPGSQDMSTTLPNTTIPILSTENTTIPTVSTKKLQIITAKKSSVSTADPSKSTPFLISKGISAMSRKSVRGSFLVRDKETLNKLAGLTKTGAAASMNVSDMSDTAGTVSIKSVKAKNFVFATLTEEEHESMKRKADDLLNSSCENGTNFMKKPKIEPRRDKCFIDQLL